MDLQAEAQASLAALRDVRAARPGPDAGALRTAYLELLKLALCDLVGTTTTSVGALPDGSLLSQELSGDERRMRGAGMDWPLHGLTMVGLTRLDDLQRCVETVVEDGVPGDVIEAGSWRGGASMLIRATLDTLGDHRSLVVADSFRGFPATDDERPTADFLAVALDEVRDAFARLGLTEDVELLPGFFEETLRGLAGRRWALVRLDADTYAPTREALRVLYPGLSAGGYLVLDDYGSFEGCRRAVDEFRAEHGITDPLEQVDFTCWRWRRADGPPVEVAHDPPLEPPVPGPPPVSAGERHVPNGRERMLSFELDQLRTRVAELEGRRRLRRWLGR